MATYKLLYTIICVRLLHASMAVKLDEIECGIDDVDEISVGSIPITKYPWYGILWYSDDQMPDEREVAQVALIHAEFVLASANEIDTIPKHDFRKRSFVLLGEDWTTARRGRGRRVRNYVIHPEYGQTHATLALVQLRDPLVLDKFRPLCPPRDILDNPTLFVIKFTGDLDRLKKEVIPMYYVPPRLCKDFYVQANLSEEMMRPPHVVCACSIEHEHICVWQWSAALIMKDVWGRWVLLGLSVYGPGCSGPTRFLDMLSYYPWIVDSLDKFRTLTISKITPHKYVLRATTLIPPTGQMSYDSLGRGVKKFTQRYGECDAEERQDRLFRDAIIILTDNDQLKVLNYNMTMLQEMDITCLMLELINASADSQMSVYHVAPREEHGPPCFTHEETRFDLSVTVSCQVTCMFEVNMYGHEKTMKSISLAAWHGEEGTYYEDFTPSRHEYAGTAIDTQFGFEPLDPVMWLPDYDIYSTTPDTNLSNMGTDKHIGSDLFWIEAWPPPEHLLVWPLYFHKQWFLKWYYPIRPWRLHRPQKPPYRRSRTNRTIKKFRRIRRYDDMPKDAT